MAALEKKRKENTESSFFVDDTCIDCGTCYWLSPGIFKNIGGKSAVVLDPQSFAQKEASHASLFSCPTNSIGFSGEDELSKTILESFPRNISEEIYHLGFHSEKSYGATSYFIQREDGNVMIDSPRYLKKLCSKMEEMGGLDWQLLTHKDDVADSLKYSENFGSTCVIHELDKTNETKDLGHYFEGNETVDFLEDFLIIPVPGHTQGSCVFLYKNKYLFTGDHLAYSLNRKQLVAFDDACWFSFEEQIKSMEKLLQYDFEWVLPGHGAPFQASSPFEMKRELEKCIKWMKGKTSSN